MEGYKILQFLFCRLTQVDCNDIAETAVLLNSETRTHNTMVSVIKKIKFVKLFPFCPNLSFISKSSIQTSQWELSW